MKKIMQTAHTIKKAASVKWDCAGSEIIFGICLSMAHKGEEIKMEIENTNEFWKNGQAIIQAIAEKKVAGTEKQMAYIEKLKARRIEYIKDCLNDYFTDEELEESRSAGDEDETEGYFVESITKWNGAGSTKPVSVESFIETLRKRDASGFISILK